MTDDEIRLHLERQTHMVCHQCKRPVQVRRFSVANRMLDMDVVCHGRKLLGVQVTLTQIEDHARVVLFGPKADQLVTAMLDRHGRHRDSTPPSLDNKQRRAP